ncbi:30S ribosomal protein S6 [Thermosulfurimonas sp. F29]|uniref:30S ribosomal protein S6 n=1 Tax=Thermosulfurimonas sp. F29 TaxID=2867247 RepID=UPI001C83B087|nr:30S ribosomal protein S6 [Thermosulfurimonas sp. F29]MBX6422149.1 30S ribosomal protein S6 [Thermosulfurimonas sp. F29]
MLEYRRPKRIRKYETLFIIHPDRVEERQEVLDRLSQIVRENDGDVLKVDEWGMRKLAYPIEKKRQGYYILVEFYGNAELPAKLEYFFRVDERVIRFIVVKLEDRYRPEEEAAAEAA